MLDCSGHKAAKPPPADVFLYASSEVFIDAHRPFTHGHGKSYHSRNLTGTWHASLFERAR
jgi:hypothetical protein